MKFYRLNQVELQVLFVMIVMITIFVMIGKHFYNINCTHHYKEIYKTGPCLILYQLLIYK